MIDLDQRVQMQWGPSNKNRFESFGYVFTKFGDSIRVKASELTYGSGKDVIVSCDYCGDKIIMPYGAYLMATKGNTVPYACRKPECRKAKDLIYFASNSRDKKYQRFIDICTNLGFEPVTTKEDIMNSRLSFICKKHGLQTRDRHQFFRGAGCPACGIGRIGEKLRLQQQDLVNLVASKNNDVLLNPEDYINVNANNLKIKCGCGRTFITSLGSFRNSHGLCEECSALKKTSARRLSKSEVVDRIEFVKGNKLLNPDEYVNNATKNLVIKCGLCGKNFITSLANYERGICRCQDCIGNMTSGEVLIREFLIKHNINYKFQYWFEDCRDIKPLPFDFFLPTQKCVVEFDGQGHFEPVYGDDVFAKRKQHDQIKDKYCQDHGIKIIRIPYWEGKEIDNILSKELLVQQTEDIV